MWFLQRVWLLRVLVTLTAFLILTSAFLLFALPKFPVIDTLLMRKGVFLVFEGVREDVFSVKLKKAKVLVRGEELFRFEELEFGVSLHGLYSWGRCGEGVLRLTVGWGGTVRLLSDGFTCVRGASSLEADVEIKGGLWGRLRIEGLEVGGTGVESVEVSFEGDRFTGIAVVGGRELKGRGRFELDVSDPANSYVDGVFRGEGVAVRVVGKLGSLSLQVLY